MAQRFPKRGFTFVAVGDVGDGIPATMRSRYSDLDDLAALQYALEPGVSSDGGGGNGLHVARQLTELVQGGVMTVESGRLRARALGEGGRSGAAAGRLRPDARVVPPGHLRGCGVACRVAGTCASPAAPARPVGPTGHGNVSAHRIGWPRPRTI
jgi:hypothetical protein